MEKARSRFTLLIGFFALTGAVRDAEALNPPKPCDERKAQVARKFSLYLGGEYIGGDNGGFAKGEGAYYDIAFRRMKSRWNDSGGLGICEWDADPIRHYLRLGGTWMSGSADGLDRFELNLGWKYLVAKNWSVAASPSGEYLWKTGNSQIFGAALLLRGDYADIVSVGGSYGGRFYGRGDFKRTEPSWSIAIGLRKSIWEEHFSRKTE